MHGRIAVLWLAAGLRSAAEQALAQPMLWRFTTGTADPHESAIVGDAATSPSSGTAMRIGCSKVTGTIQVVDAAGAKPCAQNDATILTAAGGDLGEAPHDADGLRNPGERSFGAPRQIQRLLPDALR
jgi:hypothetical protein